VCRAARSALAKGDPRLDLITARHDLQSVVTRLTGMPIELHTTPE
jgi:hypothetical protein